MLSWKFREKIGNVKIKAPGHGAFSFSGNQNSRDDDFSFDEKFTDSEAFRFRKIFEPNEGIRFVIGGNYNSLTGEDDPGDEVDAVFPAQKAEEFLRRRNGNGFFFPFLRGRNGSGAIHFRTRN